MGYRLTGGADVLSAAAVDSYLAAPRAHFCVLAQVDSTNSQCRRLAAQGAPDGTAVLADCQSAGRGRRGRSFQSPPGLGLYLSVLWRPQCTPEMLLPLTSLAAVAACRAVERVAAARPQIKWPNDLVLRGRKLAGMLTELAVEGESGMVDSVVLGIGLNVHQRQADFAGEVADIATSLDMALGGHFSRSALAAALLEELDTLRREVLFQPSLWLEEYRRGCVNIGQTVQLLREGACQTVTALTVDGQYGLVVRHQDGHEEIVRAGEVSVRGLYGYTD